MPRILDLSIPLENDMPADPAFQRVHIAHKAHAETAADLAASFPSLRPDQLPDGQGWAVKLATIFTHNGTYVDDPFPIWWCLRAFSDWGYGCQAGPLSFCRLPFPWVTRFSSRSAHGRRMMGSGG